MEFDAYLATMAQLSKHVVDATELRATGDNIGEVENCIKCVQMLY